jgi:hypothetical protein
MPAKLGLRHAAGTTERTQMTAQLFGEGDVCFHTHTIKPKNDFRKKICLD